MKTHELKTIEPFFTDVWLGLKKFEVRENDRNYERGDYLLLRAFNPITEEYNGTRILCLVEYVLRAQDFIMGLRPNYCVMSITVINRMIGY